MQDESDACHLPVGIGNIAARRGEADNIPEAVRRDLDPCLPAIQEAAQHDFPGSAFLERGERKLDLNPLDAIGQTLPLKMPHQIGQRSEEHTSELQSLMRISYAVFCLKKKKKTHI